MIASISIAFILGGLGGLVAIAGFNLPYWFPIFTAFSLALLVYIGSKIEQYQTSKIKKELLKEISKEIK